MIKRKKQGLFIVISGPSGTGKGTIVKELLQHNSNLWLSTSVTSRAPRGQEQDGVEYHFVSKQEFERKIKNDEFLEYAIVHSDQYYGTPKSPIKRALRDGYDVLLEIDIEGALKVKELVKEAVFIFILPPSLTVLKNRLINRGTEDEEKITSRFKKAYKEINEVTKYNYAVVNDVLEEAVLEVESIIKAERCRVDRIEEVFLNTPNEEVHEALLPHKDFKNEQIELLRK